MDHPFVKERTQGVNGGEIRLIESFGANVKTTTLEITKQLAGDGTLVLSLNGRLSLETVSVFLQEVRPLEAEKLALEMSAVRFLDSGGIGALVRLFVHRNEQGLKFALIALAQQGKAAMEVSGLLKILPTYASVQEALDQMA